MFRLAAPAHRLISTHRGEFAVQLSMEAIRKRIIDWKKADQPAMQAQGSNLSTGELDELREMASNIEAGTVAMQADALAIADEARAAMMTAIGTASQALYEHMKWIGNMPESIFTLDEIAHMSPRVMASGHMFASNAAVRRLLTDPERMAEKVSHLDQNGGPKVLEALQEAQFRKQAMDRSAEEFRIASTRNFFAAEIMAKASSPDCTMDAASLREHMRSISSSGSVADMARVMSDVRNEIAAEEHAAPAYG
jgi:hypothetical protein